VAAGGYREASHAGRASLAGSERESERAYHAGPQGESRLSKCDRDGDVLR